VCEASLIELMVCCVNQAAGGTEVLVGRGGTTAGRKYTSKEKQQLAEDKQRLTAHFISVLPRLLAKVFQFNINLSDSLQFNINDEKQVENNYTIQPNISHRLVSVWLHTKML